MHDNDFIQVILSQQNRPIPELLLDFKTFCYDLSYPLFSSCYFNHRTCGSMGLFSDIFNSQQLHATVQKYIQLQQSFLKKRQINNTQYFTKLAQANIYTTPKLLLALYLQKANPI